MLIRAELDGRCAPDRPVRPRLPARFAVTLWLTGLFMGIVLTSALALYWSQRTAPAAMPTQSQLDTLDAAIATGAREVRFQDQTVIYNSIKDMMTARTLLYNQLHPTGTAPAVTRQYRMTTNKGF
jgi:hypothetical protein